MNGIPSQLWRPRGRVAGVGRGYDSPLGAPRQPPAAGPASPAPSTGPPQRCPLTPNQLKEIITFIFLLKKAKRFCHWRCLKQNVPCLILLIIKSPEVFIHFLVQTYRTLFLADKTKRASHILGEPAGHLEGLSYTCAEIGLHNRVTNELLKKNNRRPFRPVFEYDNLFLLLRIRKTENLNMIRINILKTVMRCGHMTQRIIDNLRFKSSLADQLVGYAAFGQMCSLINIPLSAPQSASQNTITGPKGQPKIVGLMLKISFRRRSNRLRVNIIKFREKFKSPGQGRVKIKMKEINNAEVGMLMQRAHELATCAEITHYLVASNMINMLMLKVTLAKPASQGHPKIHLNVVYTTYALVTKTSRSMVSSVVTTIEIIVTLRSDSVTDVSTTANEAMADVTTALQSKANKQYGQQCLYELLEERVYSIATRLPTTIRQKDDRSSLSCIQQLLGCVEVLGSGLASLMGHPAHAQRLLRALATALTLDTTDSDLMLERAFQQDPLENLNVKPQLGQNFSYFQDTNILQAISQVLQVVGHSADLTLVVDLCLDLLQESQYQRKECLLIISFILKGKPHIKTEVLSSENKDMLNTENVTKDAEDATLEAETSAVEAILDIVMPYLSLPTSCQASAYNQYNEENNKSMQELVPMKSSSNISVEAARENIVVVANTLRVIGSCAVRIGPEFIIYLRRVLCDLMEKAGDSNVLVAHTARETLVSVAAACGHNSSAELIEKSFPHFWFTLSTRLKRLNQHPQAPLVLQVALEFVSLNIMNYMEDLAKEILLSLDAYHSQRGGAAPLLRVLLVYVMAVAKHDKTQEKQTKTRHKGENTESNEKLEKSDEEASEKLGEIALFLIDYHKTQTTVRNAFNGDIESDNSNLSGREGFQEHYRKNILEKDNNFSNDNIENNDEISDDKIKPPPYIELVVKILERCSYLLFTHDRELQLVILETICGGCSALEDWEDQKLPSMHILWKPLVLRLKDKDFVVVLRSLETLSDMVSSSGEFLRKRSQEEVLPHLWTFLINQANTSMGKGNPAAAYKMTQAYRAQLKLLRNVPKIYQSLNLDSLQVSKLMEAIVPYLDTRQPIELCNAAVEIVTVVAANHPHHIWLTLAHLCQPGLLTHPSPLLKPIKVGVALSDLPVPTMHAY
ncbi:unnamed protein product, partial [Meganyctiphanes norvegica]